MRSNNLKELTEGLKDKTVLITGGTGKLAQAFHNSIKTLTPETRVFLTTKEDLNVEDSAAFKKYLKFNPNVVIHCAARVNADYCETNFTEAKENIIGGTRNTVRFTEETGSKIFYPQSFLIFDGKTDPVDENVTPNPVSNYGKLKLEAENLVLHQANSLAVRMGGFFGGGKYDTNFVGKFTRQISTLISSGKHEIDIGDRIWQPTFTTDLAENSLILLALGKCGIYNMAGHGQATFFDVANFIVDSLQLENQIRVNKMAPNYTKHLDIALRPSSINMVNARLISESLDFQRHWRVSLKEYLESQDFKLAYPFD